MPYCVHLIFSFDLCFVSICYPRPGKWCSLILTEIWECDGKERKVPPRADGLRNNSEMPDTGSSCNLCGRECVFVCVIKGSCEVCVLKGSPVKCMCVYVCGTGCWLCCSKSSQMECRCASLSGEFCQSYTRYNWAFAFLAEAFFMLCGLNEQIKHTSPFPVGCVCQNYNTAHIAFSLIGQTDLFNPKTQHKWTLIKK